MKTKTCSITSCRNAAYRRGFCAAHYRRLLRHGDPLAGRSLRIAGDDVTRFWAKVKKLPGRNACWEWTGSVNATGYGQFRVNGRPVGAHRFSYANFVGPIPEGLFVCHTCDNPPCVRPSHLRAATRSWNTLDSVSKGRHKTPWRKEKTA